MDLAAAYLLPATEMTYHTDVYVGGSTLPCLWPSNYMIRIAGVLHLRNNPVLGRDLRLA